jgi:hypothetical protein
LYCGGWVKWCPYFYVAEGSSDVLTFMSWKGQAMALFLCRGRVKWCPYFRVTEGSNYILIFMSRRVKWYPYFHIAEGSSEILIFMSQKGQVMSLFSCRGRAKWCPYFHVAEGSNDFLIFMLRKDQVMSLYLCCGRIKWCPYFYVAKGSNNVLIFMLQNRQMMSLFSCRGTPGFSSVSFRETLVDLMKSTKLTRRFQHVVLVAKFCAVNGSSLLRTSFRISAILRRSSMVSFILSIHFGISQRFCHEDFFQSHSKQYLMLSHYYWWSRVFWYVAHCWLFIP